jgi:hypothetical protein
MSKVASQFLIIFGVLEYNIQDMHIKNKIIDSLVQGTTYFVD